MSPLARPLVLLIENEPLQRMILADFIDEAGCDCIEVWNTASAIRELKTRPEIHVVVADLDMCDRPRGSELMALIRERWPPVELLLTGALRPAAETLPVRGVFFDKPFDQKRFTKTLRSLAGLEGTADSA